MKLKEYKIIYVACKFGGDAERIKLVEETIKILIEDDRKRGAENVIYFSPIHSFGYLYDITEYDEGLNYTLACLARCDELYVVEDKWSESIGVCQEIGVAKALGIPIKYI